MTSRFVLSMRFSSCGFWQLHLGYVEGVSLFLFCYMAGGVDWCCGFLAGDGHESIVLVMRGAKGFVSNEVYPR